MTELNFTNNPKHAVLVKKDFTLESSYLGLVDYEKAVEIQSSLSRLALLKNQNSVLGLHHPEVITLGRRAEESIEINLNNSKDSIPIVRSSRGGLATIHSPGQLVIYPIMNIKHLKLGVRGYVCLLLKSSQELLKAYGISATIDLNGAGLFTENGKICFCGIQIQDGISRHGISLNVRNDLGLFNVIRSCGVQNLKLDAIKNYQVDDTLGEIFQKWITSFQKNISLLS